jgi:hypothetical protein
MTQRASLFDTHAHVLSADLVRYPYSTLRGGAKPPVNPVVFAVEDLLRAMDAGGVDQLLDDGLIFPAGLQEIDADGASHRDHGIRRLGVEALEAGDKLESTEFAGRRALALGAGGETGAWSSRTGRHVNLVQRVAITLGKTDRPEQLFGAAEPQPFFAVAGSVDLGSRRTVCGDTSDSDEQQSNTEHEIFHWWPLIAN